MRGLFNNLRLQRELRSASVALEEASDGQTSQEIEHTFYARVTDFAQLEGAPFEDHEQWELKIAKAETNLGEGVIRIRKTTDQAGKSECVLTVKTKAKDAVGRAETSMLTTEDQFKQFILLASKGMLKRRYQFPVAGTELVWEFDLYPKEDGGWHEWCKIDLEVKSLKEALPKLPIKVEQLISKPYGQRSDEEEAQVRQLYDSVFTMSREQIERVNAQR